MVEWQVLLRVSRFPDVYALETETTDHEKKRIPLGKDCALHRTLSPPQQGDHLGTEEAGEGEVTTIERKTGLSSPQVNPAAFSR